MKKKEIKRGGVYTDVRYFYEDSMSEDRKALMRAIWYNGLDEEVAKWADLEEDEYGHIDCPFLYSDERPDDDILLIWMMGVLMFGNYGTSPRGGWIEDIDKWKKWIADITLFYDPDEED